jgi:hypothetical protein
MGLESFDLPCGSAADVAELEYISALHQTGESVRLDGSVKGRCGTRTAWHGLFAMSKKKSLEEEWGVTYHEVSPFDLTTNLFFPPLLGPLALLRLLDIACDIRLYLASRFGITITEEQVKDIVLHGLTADANDVLDLVEVVACLLMPTLLKVKNQQAGNPLPHFVVEADKDLVEKVLKTIQRDVLLGVSLTW